MSTSSYLSFLQGIVIVALLSAGVVSCGQREERLKADINKRIDSLASAPIDYVGDRIFCVINPQGDKLYVLETAVAKAIKALEAKDIGEGKWDIQFTADTRTVVSVTAVSSPAAFTTLFPVALIGLHVVFDSTDCVAVPRVEGDCVNRDYVSEKRSNTAYNTCDEATTGTVGRECHGIWTVVGRVIFYTARNCPDDKEFRRVDFEDWVCAW